MLIKCINTGGSSLSIADIASGNTRSSNFHVYLGREYRVYGLLFHDAVISFLIVDETGVPMWEPASLFQVLCGRPSRHWRFYNFSMNLYFGVMSFPELVGSVELFEKLALGDNEARANFFKRKKIADLEFLDSSVVDKAESIGNAWVQCPSCSEAWEVIGADALVRCPKCQKVCRNPIYCCKENE
jgi:hypothetical protein